MKSIESKWYYIGDCLPGAKEDMAVVRLVYCLPEDEEDAQDFWNAGTHSEWEAPHEWMVSFCFARYIGGEWFLHSVPEDVREHKKFKFAVTHWSEGVWEPEEEFE